MVFVEHGEVAKLRSLGTYRTIGIRVLTRFRPDKFKMPTAPGMSASPAILKVPGISAHSRGRLILNLVGLFAQETLNVGLQRCTDRH
jgi:hypothetical protein